MIYPSFRSTSYFLFLRGGLCETFTCSNYNTFHTRNMLVAFLLLSRFFRNAIYSEYAFVNTSNDECLFFSLISSRIHTSQNLTYSLMSHRKRMLATLQQCRIFAKFFLSNPSRFVIIFLAFSRKNAVCSTPLATRPLIRMGVKPAAREHAFRKEKKMPKATFSF